MKKRKHPNFTGFLDLLFILLLVTVSMFKLMTVEARKADIRTKAEFVISVKWPTNNPDDVDTWLRDPNGDICSFKKKEVGLMHLDRDDLGKVNDTIRLANGEIVEFPHNQELTTIRGILGGEWTLNIHMYKKRSKEATPVDVSITKLNPTAKTIFAKQVMLAQNFQEETIIRFVTAEDGDILEYYDDLPAQLVESQYTGNPQN